MPATPILSSMARTIRYHLGTLAKGSFIITLVKIPRLILTYIHSQLKGKVSCEIMQSNKVYIKKFYKLKNVIMASCCVNYVSMCQLSVLFKYI